MSVDSAHRAVFEASARHRAHSIVERDDARAALAFVRELSAIFESGYRLQLIPKRKAP